MSGAKSRGKRDDSAARMNGGGSLTNPQLADDAQLKIRHRPGNTGQVERSIKTFLGRWSLRRRRGERSCLNTRGNQYVLISHSGLEGGLRPIWTSGSSCMHRLKGRLSRLSTSHSRERQTVTRPRWP